MDYTYSSSGNVISRAAKVKGANFIVNKGKSLIDAGAEIRGDLNDGTPVITWGIYTCLMKDSSIRPPQRKGKHYPVTIGNHVYIGPNVKCEAASIGSCVAIGKGASIGRFAIIKDCVVIAPNTVIPPFAVVAPMTFVEDKLVNSEALPESAQPVIERYCRDIHSGQRATFPFSETFNIR